MRSLHSRNSTRYDVPSVTLAVLSSPCFALLLERIGVDALHQLLAHTRLFWPLQNDCLLQLTGPRPGWQPAQQPSPIPRAPLPGRPAHSRRAAARDGHADGGAGGAARSAQQKAAVEQLAAPPRNGGVAEGAWLV